MDKPPYHNKVSFIEGEEVGEWWGGFGSHGCAGKLEQMPVHELKVVVMQDGFK